MQVNINNVDLIHRANLATIGKKMKATWTPTKAWSLEQLHAQHSTLEWAEIVIEANVSGTVASHITRATKGHPRFAVQSHRPDWTGEARPPASTLRTIVIKCNPYAFVEMCRQRLCNLAADETRAFFLTAVKAMCNHESVFLQALGDYVAPDCVYRGNVCHMHRKAWENCRMVNHWHDA